MQSYEKENRKKSYSIERNDEILLYGYNQYCREQADRLLEEGYTVAGILDRNAKGDDIYHGIKIVSSVGAFPVSAKTCVFIMLQNGVLHWDIARDLYQRGVRRALFLPMKTGFYSDAIQNEFMIQYNYMMEGSYSLMRVPYLQKEMFDTAGSRQWRLARQLDSGECIIWIAKQLLRTTMTEEEKYRDIPVEEFAPYVNLFSYLSGNKRDISEYIRLYGFAPFPAASKEALDYVVDKRRALYDFFEEKFAAGNMDYFVAAAPKAAWNEKGYLNLCEGQHRCVYLLEKGFQYVPVRIDKNGMDQLSEDV